MARQLKLSIACALMFLVALLGLPLANYYAPELMATRVFGFTLTWFVLGVLFFPFVWIISYVSMALERVEVEEVKRNAPTEDPRSKIQDPEKHQAPRSNGGAALGLVLGPWIFSGAWFLVLGA